MDYEEEQEMEAEALQAILMDSIQMVDGNSNYTIDIVPFQEEEEENFVGVKLHVKLPEKYPDEAPGVEVESTKGLSPNSLEEVQQLVKDFIEEQLTDNPSTPIMYMLVESVREWLLSNNVKGDDGSAWSSMMKREAAKKKEEEAEKEQYEEQMEKITIGETEEKERLLLKARSEGTPCTKENFEIWKEKFMQEMERLKKEKQESGGKENAQELKEEKDRAERKTGYEMFQDKTNSIDITMLSGETEDEEGVGDFDESLYLDGDDDDLDDLDFEDDDDDNEDEEEGDEDDI
ncbi:hypothetical protein TrCOL_g7013 [Triparma columacea]|uniref:RWD domain-containing protein n=1 Tax=Triparma columacea TaxID=722753 RepID=A0A9W7G7W3_9STRA|nr:hypothetical protein TrCOL_g7013 [Triparma columacea]